MKAITLHQPWASLIIGRAKQYETRSWCPPSTLFGQRIAIHAGKKQITQQLFDALPIRVQTWCAMHYGSLIEFEYGVILGTVQLISAFHIHDTSGTTPNMFHGEIYDGFVWGEYNTMETTEYEIEKGDFSIGRYAWRMDKVNRFIKPVPQKGHQGFWECDPMTEEIQWRQNHA